MFNQPFTDKERVMCDHKFVHGGVKYEIQEWKIPGGGAQPVYYFDWFYCEKCLQNEYQRLAESSNTYEPIRFEATPKSR